MSSQTKRKANLNSDYKRSRDRRRKARKKLVKRGSSPSHFYVNEEDELSYGPNYTLESSERIRADALLRSVSSLYYQPKEVHSSGLNQGERDEEMMRVIRNEQRELREMRRKIR